MKLKKTPQYFSTEPIFGLPLYKSGKLPLYKNIYLYSYIFSFAINYEYVIRNKNKLTACNTAPTGLLFADWLKKKGYSVQLQKKYRDSELLTAICKGAMYRIVGVWMLMMP